ncbi:MFS transporter [Aspergillus japonicus CBS 114.51]|uniref:MFS transporter n=1 Tax=Aspergillus japonicus CBS 114.51 TaxID=1448312 RepID=A0A8T8XCL3_ASPJA|nr:MFS transporter [Aspergillus japonicus CBS 114.51]RAH85996.1 MFS transporter [Aspergillus japonicus CBS 114.51]
MPDTMPSSAQTPEISNRSPNDLTRPSKATVTWTMASLCLSVLLSALDLTIVTTAMPSIVGTFQAAAGYTWVGGAYTLANAAVTPVWGTVADIWGRKPVILMAIAVFLVGSLLCALAHTMNVLLVGRVIQGLGGSGIGIMVNIIISDLFSLRDRGLYLAITSLVWAVGSAIGPVLGGVFATKLSWRWCFWINLPVGVISFAVLLLCLKVPSPKTPMAAGLKAIDWAGILLMVGGALMILLALDLGDIVYTWSSATVLCLLVFGVLSMGLFAVNEYKIARNPVIPFRLFSSPTKAAPYVVFACNNYVFIGLAYYLPLYAQAVLGASALTSGLYLLPLIVSCALAAAAAGLYMQQSGRYRPVMYIAQVLLLLGTGLLIGLHFETALARLLIFQTLAGIGVGMNLDPPILAAQAATTVRDTAAVTATMSFVRSLATAVAVVVGGVVFQNEMTAAQGALVAQLGGALASGFDGDLAASNVEQIARLPAPQRLLVRRTYFQALRMVWVMYVAFAGLASLLTLLIRAHTLRRENEGPVLGVDRARPDGAPAEPGNEMDSVGRSENVSGGD